MLVTTISEHGSTAQTLVEQRLEVMKAMSDLLTAMETATPLDVDYPTGDRLTAQLAWRERLLQVAQLHADVEVNDEDYAGGSEGVDG